MASFTCYLAYTGFHVDLRKNIVRFNPVVKNDEYHYFIITKNGFGLCHKEKGKELFVETLFGNLQDLKIIGE